MRPIREAMPELAKWTPSEVAVVTKDGDRKVPGITNALIPGLAVTMLNFGHFVVTHVATGRKVVGPWERFGGACHAAAQLARIADWTQSDGFSIAAQIEERGDEPCGVPQCTVTGGGGTRPMTKRELFESLRNWIVDDEFPWEDPADDPMLRCDEVLALLAERAP